MLLVLVLLNVTAPLYVLPEESSSSKYAVPLLVKLVVELNVLFPCVLRLPSAVFTMVVVPPKVLLPAPESSELPFFSRYAVPPTVNPSRNNRGALKSTSPPKEEFGPTRRMVDPVRFSVLFEAP